MVRKKTESIHVPDAPHRPGDEPKFEQWSWKPEDLNRLDIECSVDDAQNHATGLVRVLNDNHEAKGEWNPNCLLYTSPSPRDQRGSRMPSSA